MTEGQTGGQEHCCRGPDSEPGHPRECGRGRSLHVPGLLAPRLSGADDNSCPSLLLGRLELGCARYPPPFLARSKLSVTGETEWEVPLLPIAVCSDGGPISV